MKLEKLAVVVVPLSLLVACGGGGGGGSSWLTFDRYTAQVTMYEGESPEVRVEATASSAPDSYPQVQVTSDGVLFDPGSLGYYEDGLSGSVYGDLRNDLTVGTHEGWLQVRVCKDDPSQCNEPFDGSPWRIRVVVTVLPDPGNPTSPLNGDFSAGMSGWTTYTSQGGAATFSTPGGQLLAAISNGGQETWSVQMHYTGGIDLEAGRRYRLSFDARADAPRLIEAFVEEGRDRDGDGYGSIYTQPIPSYSLGTTMQSFHTDFTMSETNRAASLYFMLGGATADVYLDNIEVTDVTP